MLNFLETLFKCYNDHIEKAKFAAFELTIYACIVISYNSYGFILW